MITMMMVLMLEVDDDRACEIERRGRREWDEKNLINDDDGG